MADLRPFRALRPTPGAAPRVAAVPYDVVDTGEARALAAGEPWSFLHVTRPEIDLPEGTDPHSDAVYAAGRRALERLVAEGALARDPEPALYVYRLTDGDHRQVGLAGCFPVDDYDADLIRKHERTRPDKEDDRTRHLLALGCHPEPVLLTYRGERAVDHRVARIVAEEAPLVDFTAPDGVGHTLWRVADPEPLVAAFAAVGVLYVADGHHRSAAASRARAARQQDDPAAAGERPWDVFLAVAFPAAEMRILPYHRVVRDLGGLAQDELLDRLGREMTVTPDAPPQPTRKGTFGMFLGGRWYGLEAPGRLVAAADPVESLDAAILQSRVLAPLLGIDDPRTSARLDFVGGSRGTGELERRVRAGGGVAFSLHPVSVEELMAVADAGRVLPPKSTWFEPKLRSGLVIHEM